MQGALLLVYSTAASRSEHNTWWVSPDEISNQGGGTLKSANRLSKDWGPLQTVSKDLTRAAMIYLCCGGLTIELPTTSFA